MGGVAEVGNDDLYQRQRDDSEGTWDDGERARDGGEEANDSSKGGRDGSKEASDGDKGGRDGDKGGTDGGEGAEDAGEGAADGGDGTADGGNGAKDGSEGAGGEGARDYTDGKGTGKVAETSVVLTSSRDLSSLYETEMLQYTVLSLLSIAAGKINFIIAYNEISIQIQEKSVEQNNVPGNW